MSLIDADGTIAERWGPLFDLDDVRASLDGLRPWWTRPAIVVFRRVPVAWTAWNSSR